MLTFFHDTRNIMTRSPYGAVECGEEVRLSVFCREDCPEWPAEILESSLVLGFYDTADETERDLEGRVQEMSSREIPLEARFVDAACDVPADFARASDGAMLKGDYRVFSTVLKQDEPGVLRYGFRFRVRERGREFELFYGSAAENGKGGTGVCAEASSGNLFRITVARRGLTVPEWFRHGVIYQIFPDRFAKGYDALCEHKPDSFMYGTWDDTPMYVRGESGEIVRWDFQGGNLSGVNGKLPYIESLGADIIYLNPVFRAASNHRYDTEDYMHVDGLLGGDPALDLLLFVCAKEKIKVILDGVFSHTGSDSIYFDKKGRFGGGAYGNPRSKYRDWYSFSEESDDEYDCWWGVKVLPNVNELAPGYIDFIVENDDSVVRHWLRKGISGWRLDVADELPDKFIKELRAAADETGAETGTEPVILGEVWEDASDKFSYGKLRSYFTERELHTVTNYPFRKTLLSFYSSGISAGDAYGVFENLRENYPRQNFYALVNMTGTHDVPRLMTEMLGFCGEKRPDARRFVEGYAAVMFTFPGVPLVYYGDETGLEGGPDPDNRRTFPWGKEDKNLIAHFAKLAALRKNIPCLLDGELEFIDGGNDVFAFKRFTGDGGTGDVFVTAVTRRKAVPGEEFELVLNEPGMRFVNVETGAAVTCGGDGILRAGIGKGYVLLAGLSGENA